MREAVLRVNGVFPRRCRERAGQASLPADSHQQSHCKRCHVVGELRQQVGEAKRFRPDPFSRSQDCRRQGILAQLPPNPNPKPRTKPSTVYRCAHSEGPPATALRARSCNARGGQERVGGGPGGDRETKASPGKDRRTPSTRHHYRRRQRSSRAESACTSLRC